MPVTIREYLGDEKIAQLENMGFLPNLIADMAKRQYMQDRQAKRNELADSGLDGKLVQGIMRGDVSEEEARSAQKFEDFGAKKHGWGLGAAKTVAGIANAAERVSDFVNPFYEGQRDEKGNYVYQNAIEKGLRPKIKSAEKLRDDYEKATGETSWGSRVAEIGTEMVADPINFVGGMGLLSKGSKLAQFGKKSLFFAGTGAASGGVMALGEGKNDEETLKNMGYGAAGGFVLGHAIDQGIQGIGKLIAKRRASKAANEADAVGEAENSEFLRATDELGGSEIKAAGGKQAKVANGQDGGIPPGGGAGGVKTAQADDIAQTMTAREFATSEAGLDEATAAKVVKEAVQGKEKSDFVDADTYADIVKFKNFENQRDYAKAYGEQIEAAKQSLNNAREQSAVRYADTQRAINEYQKQGMSASATRELINAKFKPSADEINYTRAYNGGADVDPRLAGQGIFYAIEKDIAAQAYTPEIYAARLKQRGFSDESAQAFTQAYIQKDINIAKDWANGKVAEVYENNARTQVAAEIKAKNEIEGEGWTMKDGGEAKQYAEHKFEPEKWINDLSGVLSDEWIANLKSLALKHPEMFKSEADVFRVIKEIKDNPTHFFKNNNDRNALLVKNLKVGKSGEIAVRKTDGQIVHTTINNEKRLDRLQKRNKENLGNGELSKVEYSDGARRLPRHSDQSRTMPTAKAESAADDAGIIQTFTRPGSKLENQGLSYQDETIISQKGNLVNEKETNGLRDSVSSVGDNASRAGGRQAGDEQILRQGRRDTTNASQTKRAAQSDEQMEQQWAAKADGEADAAAATKQVVEKQGGGNNEVAHRFTIDDAINAKLNFINENNLGKEGWLDKLNAVIKKYDLKEAETKNEFMGVMIRDRFKYGREFDFPSMKDVMPKISPLKPQYHEILNGAHKELNEILKNKTIPATREQNLKFHAANSNVHLGSGLVAGTLNSIDEDGNFSPERFAAGFLTGLAGSKAAVVALRKVAPKLYENLTNTAKSFSDKGIKKIRGEIEKINGITPIKEFGENYAEFYHNGKGAVQKLLAEEHGQVAGAFYRDDLGDITLPWGEAGTGRSDGWGLAKIKRFHPEVMDRLDEIIRDGKFYFDEKGRPNIKLGDEIVGLKDNWLGKETPYWIVSSYDKSLKARPSEGINSARSEKAIGENFSSETGHETIIPQNLDDAASNLPKPEDIIAKHPNVERELDESIAAMRIESFNDSNFKDGLISKFDKKEIITQELGKSVNLSDKQLAVLKNDIKNADFKVINESKIYFDKIGKDGDKKRFFVDIAEDGSLRVDGYSKKDIDSIPVKQSALEELAGAGDAARLKNMSFEVKAAYRNELDPIKKEAILKTAELNKLKKAAQGGDKAAAAKFEEFKAKNLDENGNIKDGLSLC
ncbi:hypothetical protein [Campylobacter sp.]|uniref:putative barnase/colicin E5 family endoribonuclease n=1 Tax=Campylobacter sp. TaxID=205 RepID=UPI00361E7787